MYHSVLDRNDIVQKAKLFWNSKDKNARIRIGSKYQHIVSRFGIKIDDWISGFDSLTKVQQNLIIKGELIRFYDSLPNIDKTTIMFDFNLSTFSSKWYKLPGKDKKILLNYILP
jgi:hypothetical protein